MKSLLHMIVLCRTLSCAWPVPPNTEQATEKDNQLAEKWHSYTVNEIWRHRLEVPHIWEYAIIPLFPRWKKKTLTYRISKYTKQMTHAEVDEIIKKAFGVWSQYTCLNFTQSWDASDIDISFGVRIHSDIPEDCPFDGKKDVLAHAFVSVEDDIKGYVHFDDDEKWTKDLRGSNLFHVAVHEIGHILALDHSSINEAVMYAYYEGQDSITFQLHQDDIDGIQAVYGHPGNCSHQPNHPEPLLKQKSQDLCDLNISFEAVTTFQGHIYFFADRDFILKDPVERRHVEKSIASLWPILKCGIDAAYEVEDKHTLYIFKGRKYRTVVGDIHNLSLPEFTSTLGFPEKPIDAAVHDQETKETLFFSGDEYWSFDEETRSIDEGYPRKIAADFPEIGSRVDAAFQYNGILYLLRGQKQYEFDSTTYELIDIKKTTSWFGCPE
ncbi:stromelysin-1-like isoform X2 [Eublepharis macularius]|uniref:Stromelysin-1-like isoform X2 n=1 Tax=Eublepharis macularius TaxID=481883 RepID=A0AA97J277_EUBMA|nr:stromelysin-1-like isoform X2 [Eublepharis macularius]